MNDEPKLKLAKKGVPPPYPLNKISRTVLVSIARSLFAAKYVRNLNDLTGDEWERVFANAIGANWAASNFGLDDVQLANTCWGAKTVKSQKPKEQSSVRLISGRNSLHFSYQNSDVLAMHPDEVGKKILEIYNSRMDAVLARFAHVRLIILMKGPNLASAAVFEVDGKRYNTADFVWTWNKNGNLTGLDTSGIHRFTWQPHGAQFTIIYEVPPQRHFIELLVPSNVKPLPADKLIDELGFTDSWIRIS